jgi:predicted nucleic acid-binding protein
VLALYLRQGLFSLEDAHQIMDEALRLMRGNEYEVTSLHVLSLAASSACSACDCEFMALAQDLGVPLVTVDRQILVQFSETSISLDDFVSRPVS